MRPLQFIAVGWLVTTLSSGSSAVAVQPASLSQGDLGQRFLLQINYDQRNIGFNTSRSRVVTFRREGAALQMLDVSDAQAKRPAARPGDDPDIQRNPQHARRRSE